MLATCINTESQNFNDKRLLITDPDYADNQQMKRDIQLMKATMSQLQTTVNTLNAKVIGQDKQIQSQNIQIQNQDRQIQSQHTQIQNQDGQIQSQKMQIQNQDRQIQTHHSVITSFQNNPPGSVYVRWGRKECPNNSTEMVYSGIGAGGHYTNPGRPTNQVCVPHDPDLGKVSHGSYFGTVYGMEYDTNEFGSNLIDKDVPCAVCRVSHASTILMIPGKSQCYAGWKTEYSGNLMSGHHSHAGGSQYICVDSSPDVLEAGSRNDNGYLLYGTKAYCGSLKCPPYVQDTFFKCVVCSR
ncbi:short-chain collagen C4-like [Mytilus edulis]|uniref:short-chain collagen C4-like n=1 Tax=Mytilus edulis TaxID=6550 RepID=UPI0039EE2A29